MGDRAFEDREGCSVPSTTAIAPADYDFDSCGVPDASVLSPFTRNAIPGSIPQPSKTAQEGCIIGFMVLGEITDVQSSDGPPSDHKYKAEDQNGALSIDTWTEPMNANWRPVSTAVSPAEVGDKCILGYWGGEKHVVAFEKSGDAEGVSSTYVEGDNIWIEADNTDPAAPIINHIGPDTTGSSTDVYSVDSGSISMSGGSRFVEIVLDKITLNRDAKGHSNSPTIADKNATICIDISCLTGNVLLDASNHVDTVAYTNYTNKGEIIQRCGAQWKVLEPGTEGQVLTSHTNTTLVSWETIVPITLAGDDIWIEADNTDPEAPIINHIGPNYDETGYYLQIYGNFGGGTYFNSGVKDASICGLRFDIKGHLMQFTLDAANWLDWPTEATDWPTGS